MRPGDLEAVLDQGEAILRFPYDEGLRLVLRAIPGRRWDPLRRAWCVPLGESQARSLARVLQGRPGAQVSPELARALSRVRPPAECLIEAVRPDGDWWLGFASDLPEGPAAQAARRLAALPGAREVPEAGRALLPADPSLEPVLAGIAAEGLPLRLTSEARRLLAPARTAAEREEERGEEAHEVVFRRDRRGEHWILLAPRLARLARMLAERAGLRAAAGPAGTLGLAADERAAESLRDVLAHLEDASVEPRVESWIARACTWRGTVDVGGAPEPSFLLLGPRERLPAALGDHARETPGGAAVPLTEPLWREIATRLDHWLTPAARRCARALQEGRPAPPAVLECSQVHEVPAFVLAPGHDTGAPGAFAALPGALAPAGTRGGHEHHSLASLRADPFCVPALDALIEQRGVWVEPRALELLQEIREEHAHAAGVVALSEAGEAELEVAGLGGELKPFQRAGVRYALERRRTFLADEQGLGKTVQALAALEADGAFPALVLCPASLRLNWLREAERWLPGRSARLYARGAHAGADVTVVSYETAAARCEELEALAPQALVLDESHYCKNPAAKRTQAATRLAAAVPREGLVLALTGTPVTNRPGELVAQLRVLGRLGEFGSGAEFGRRFRGADAHLRLHWHLRARCLARRLKADVLPQLPPKTRAVVPVELDNEAEYRLAERDLVAWLRSQPLDLRELDAKVAAALRAERLVRLGALGRLAARGKLHAALAWIHDFASSGEPLVVFARHREIQHAVLERFPHALHILGEDSAAEREHALRAFQEPDGSGGALIVCSLQVAGHGLTLTRSSNVCFLELDWTPARHDQAEDRCHRIGQRDAVTAYYLLAADTVDETIARLLERKRAVIGAVTDGRAEDEAGVAEALVRELRGAEPYRHLRAVA